MKLYYQKLWWKVALLIMAILIAFGSLYYTNELVQKLAIEESKKVELWAEATRKLGSPETDNQDFGFLLEVIQNNRTVPVILTDSSDRIISYRNIDSIKALDSTYLYAQLSEMKRDKHRITIQVGNDNINYVYYKQSYLLLQLQIYPYIQLGIILIFILVAYFAFSSSRKAEQNQVWVGLTKETAHQLGTPTSSLMAISEILKERNIEEDIIRELDNDVKRLSIITERFSKVGSRPALANIDIKEVIDNVINYIKSRTSNKIKYNTIYQTDNTTAKISKTLFEWVIENVCKNAIDAINGEGQITVEVKKIKNLLIIDIADNGKGIPKRRYKDIFKPGYTTKNRGWGLGLSLAKRIVEDYHKGKIFVLNSEIGKGTTFRITIKAV